MTLEEFRKVRQGDKVKIVGAVTNDQKPMVGYIVTVFHKHYDAITCGEEPMIGDDIPACLIEYPTEADFNADEVRRKARPGEYIRLRDDPTGKPRQAYLFSVEPKGWTGEDCKFVGVKTDEDPYELRCVHLWEYVVLNKYPETKEAKDDERPKKND